MFVSTLRWKIVETSSEEALGLTKDFEDSSKRAQLFCCHLQSRVCLSSERVTELRALEGFLSTESRCKMASTTAQILRTWLFENPSFL